MYFGLMNLDEYTIWVIFFFCAGSSNDSERGSDIAYGDPQGGTKAHPGMSAPKV